MGTDRTVKLCRGDREKAQALYGRKWRQIRRWVDRGLENNDPCPLLDPAKMPAWWNRNSTWRTPAEIEQAAIRAAGGFRCASAAEGVTSPASEMKNPDSEETEPLVPIDLENFDPDDGDRLRELKQIQAARFAALKEKLKAGADTGIAESKYLKLCDTVDRIETRVMDRLRRQRIFLPREEVERAAAAMAELLYQASVSLARRVLERCPSLTSAQRAEVSTAIDHTREAQGRILARLTSFNDGAELLRELEAA